MASHAIRLHGVTYSYTRRPLIAGFDLDIAPGEVTSIVGPNGCGKSTLLKIIDGLVTPHAGEVMIGGQPARSLGGKARARRIALLPQGVRPPVMSVEALVACGRYPHHHGLRRLGPGDREHIDAALTSTGIAHLRDQDVRHLSGGERQRAYIALILAQDTDIILMDEPTTYLDVHACHEIMGLVRQLNAAGKTIIMVNHDIDLALRYSDRVAVMAGGRLLGLGDVAETLASGVIERAFHVSVDRIESANGIAYAVFPVKA
ncbi:MAG: ABC transporter ATP-binding protein [Propionibacteriaceae bacterium]|jgi:iron complex transport system ATP-binding protein|nr:ABC transporter ATP-binding protein [Propionibacteriaceae bacterium]